MPGGAEKDLNEQGCDDEQHRVERPKCERQTAYSANVDGRDRHPVSMTEAELRDCQPLCWR
jgi:hypothetical protein